MSNGVSKVSKRAWASVSYIIGGVHHRGSNSIVGGRTKQNEPIPRGDGREFRIGRDVHCHLRIDDPNLSGIAAVVREDSGRLRLYLRNRNGAVVFQPGRPTLTIPVFEGETEKPLPTEIPLVHHTVVSFAARNGDLVHLSFDAPSQVTGNALPDFDAVKARVTTPVVKPDYNLSIYDKIILTAIAVDWVAAPCWEEDPVASTPAQVVEMITECAPEFFMGRRTPPEKYTTKHLNASLKGLIRRLAYVEHTADVMGPEGGLLDRVGRWLKLGYPVTVGVALWVGDRDLAGDLNHDLAIRMQEVRNAYSSEHREAKAENGKDAARRRRTDGEAA